jgi:hypothetical protein
MHVTARGTHQRLMEFVLRAIDRDRRRKGYPNSLFIKDLRTASKTKPSYTSHE